jgi:hypothetical protein
MNWPRLLLMLALVAGQTTELPPPFPRPGTTPVFENDVVAVWNVSWLKQQYPLHTHRYDLIGISYEEGDRIITQGNAPGTLVNTKAWVFQTNRANVTHVEEGAGDPPMRAILIELKKSMPAGDAGGGSEGLRRVVGVPSWENNRAAGWMILPVFPHPRIDTLAPRWNSFLTVTSRRQRSSLPERTMPVSQRLPTDVPSSSK